MSYMPSGTVFEGVVTGVTDFGLFAEIEDTSAVKVW
ncbi:MAG: S1 RNA-binding domain-containing protein [Cytophagaceae bacterium]|nr:S1 RNA-binding domain-containing protein [Cytophagaceae bacterium]